MLGIWCTAQQSYLRPSGQLDATWPPKVDNTTSSTDLQGLRPRFSQARTYIQASFTILQNQHGVIKTVERHDGDFMLEGRNSGLVDMIQQMVEKFAIPTKRACWCSRRK